MFFRRLAVALAAILTCASARADATAEIRQRLEQWTADFNAGRKAEACDLFSKSLISDFRGQGEAGYEARCAIISRALDDSSRKLHYAADIKEIIVEGALAVVRLTWTLKVTPGDAISIEPGLDVFRREDDGQWRIIRYMAYTED
ncbi:steroid delta-isomerase [Pseudochelatococcus lubricantis]|uniref:Steroid delta-isomerase n=1 Tax=Pseudochelatococcus lubricantis TaxID=1538102 RepID=A0ABX0V0F2_9HYPH|nr:nuclear transport factor 2 family protein [Pseudochelatococcus lubricantis]NIJ58651.1 steroid delta-isomerase [Pseudochelatococcus lubricantis]